MENAGNKKLLILGSDYNTINIVKKAHERGLYVIVTDLMASSPTKDMANEAWHISTTDIDILCKKCKENNVAAICSGASDFNVNNMRKLCKLLNLPFYCDDDYSWLVARNKREFKKLCASVGAPIAKDYFLSSPSNEAELNNVCFPVVLKPSDKSGNRGMCYCNNIEELIKAYNYAKTLTNDELVIERKLCGEEYNVHYLLADGDAQMLYFTSTHHEPGFSENLYSFKATTSNHYEQFKKEVEPALLNVFKRAKCKNGIVWVDCIRDQDEHFYLLEMGYRFGGVMTYMPYEKATEFSTIDWMIDCALGINHTKNDFPNAQDKLQNKCAASYHLFSKCDCTIKSIDNLDKIESMPGIFIDFPKRQNNAVISQSCIGLIGIYANNVNELCDKLKKINELLRVKNQEDEDIIIHFDDYNTIRGLY